MSEKYRCKYDALVAISELKAHPKNRNKHPEDQIIRLAAILIFQGWRYPIKVSNQSGFVTSGHGRIEAAKLNGWTHVPVNYQDYDTDEQEYADVTADNAIASWSELNFSEINADLADLGPDFNIDLLGIRDFVLEPADKFPDPDSDDDDEIPDREPPEEPEKLLGEIQLFNADCLVTLKSFPKNTFDSLVTDPPAGISFMNKEWDSDKGGRDGWIAWLTEVMKECHRVMKPGAHGLVWAIPRTSHWTATALENAGFEVRDVVTHLFGTGFPKSLDISKAIDKAAGAEREVIGKAWVGSGNRASKSVYGDYDSPHTAGIDVTKPASDAAKQWEGWGTALKPASEHWLLIRKPLSEKTVAANVLKWGTGGLNIDASRIEASDQGALAKNWDRIQSTEAKGNLSGSMGLKAIDLRDRAPTGRFPANLVLDEEAAKALDEQSGKRIGSASASVGKGKGFASNNVNLGGGASRFFYVAKPSATEKNTHCRELPKQNSPSSMVRCNGMGDSRLDGKPMAVNNNHHPTVKPVSLMRYLARLITPPKGLLLDVFMGSGSTGVAALREEFRFVGIEREPEYFRICEKRLNYEKNKTELIVG